MYIVTCVLRTHGDHYIPIHVCMHFVLQPHGFLNKVESSIVHICVSTKHELLAWMTGIRLAKVSSILFIPIPGMRMLDLSLEASLVSLFSQFFFLSSFLAIVPLSVVCRLLQQKSWLFYVLNLLLTCLKYLSRGASVCVCV